jgi:hypothetical protein
VGATEAVDVKLAAVTDAVTEPTTEPVEGVEDAVAAVLARSAWWRAARCRFFSFSDGPRCRGRGGGEEGGVEGAEGGGRVWGAPGGPRVQLNATVAEPPLVVRLSEALPPTAQTEMNSVSDATMNWELVLEAIFTQVTECLFDVMITMCASI